MYGFVHDALVAWLLSRPDGAAEIAEIVRLSEGADTSVSFCERCCGGWNGEMEEKREAK